MKPQFEFDLELILDMINNKELMLKDVIEYYGCTRNQLAHFLRKNNLNFKNSIGAKRARANFLKENNPTKGKKRNPKEMEGLKKANRLKAVKEWDKKYKDGIKFWQYGKICRNLSYTNMNKISEKGIKEIDHIFSLKDCFKYSIYPIYASDINNLQILTSEENQSKAGRSDMTLQEFLRKIGIEDIKKAQFNWPKIENESR